MLLTDHIASFVPPADRAQRGGFGPRFPDMTAVYSPRLREKALAAAERRNIP